MNVFFLLVIKMKIIYILLAVAFIWEKQLRTQY